MKLRIKGNSLRVRLSKTEVKALADDGLLQETTRFPQGAFTYEVRSSAGIKTMSAAISNNQITLLVPADFIKTWPGNDVVGCNAVIPLRGNESLSLLLEKDFVCLDETQEDQSDNYANPKQTC